MTSGNTPSTSGLEQRRYPRVRVHFAARYLSSNLNLEGRVTDVSPDGLFFCSEFLDDQGETARLWIEVPARARPLELRGEVRWVNDTPHGGGMGLKLIDVSLEDRALLESLVPAGLASPRTRISTGNA
jgi:hypothetical protein